MIVIVIIICTSLRTWSIQGIIIYTGIQTCYTIIIVVINTLRHIIDSSIIRVLIRDRIFF